MNELTLQLVLMLGEIVGKVVAAIMASTSLTEDEKKQLLLSLSTSLDKTAAEVAAVKFK